MLVGAVSDPTTSATEGAETGAGASKMLTRPATSRIIEP